MRNNHIASILLTLSVAGSVLATACGSQSPDMDSTVTEDELGSTGDYAWWRGERTKRAASLGKFLIENEQEFKAFKNTALGSSGIPMVMLRLFPEIFPEIWGTQDQYFAPVGFGKDVIEPNRVLPLGLGYAASSPAIPTPAGPVNVNVVNLTCMGCHGGRVQVNSSFVLPVVGAPNTQFTNFRGSVYLTVTSPKYTADAFRAALAAKPAGWLYGDATMLQQEALERAVFMAPGGAEAFLTKLQQGSLFGAQRFATTLGAYTYAVPNAPNPSGSTPGYLDAIGAGISIIVDPTKLTPEQVQAAVPPAPAMIDIMSVWLQKDRPAAQWDGSIVSPIHRNLAAEFGVVGDPTKLNMQNVNDTTPFTAQLPATPYPFDVDEGSAKRGAKLYGAYCASCHAKGNATIFPAANVGTDANRANIWTPMSVGGLRQVIRAACTDAVTCNAPDGSPLPDDQLVRPTGGYMAVPLDGIWARAPYLHNGSVPNLDALLTGDRPATFYRGNIAFDQTKVGFVSETAVSKGAAIFDTSKSGNTNVGHYGPAFNGNIDWKVETKARKDLLEYMKTL
jgi:cytochrome c5